MTTWHYDALRGWLTNKVYADGKGTKYSYTGAGRPATRLWARGTNTTYSYNDFGDLSGVSYNDGATPSLSYTFTRRGQQDKITRGSDSWRLFYNLAGQLLSEAGTAGTLSGLRVTNAFDSYLRRTNLASANGATVLTTNGYTFDAGGRLSTARDGTFLATYSYLANSPLVSQIQFKSNSFVSLTTTKAYDNLNRLTSISSQPSASGLAPLTFTYSYNDANQRTRVNFADGSFWIYEYDSLGQVKSGKRYWNDWTPVAGQQFEYGFDDIGNRTSTKTGGDSTGANLRLANYTNNTLNQITGRDVPAYLNVIGAASATATNVNVNNFMAYRRGEYYRVELDAPNTSAAVWQSVTNRAVQSGTTNSVTGNLFLPKHPEVFTYDADGNLTNDGRWMLTWDAENQLIKAESHTSAPTTSKRKVEFTRDWRGILIRRIEYNGSSGSYVVTNDLKFLNDSLHCIAELNGTNNALVRSYLWGLDLSGTMNGAGSVGGLLVVNSKANGAHFPAFDGNGNVAALINAADGSVSARYDYAAFGERLRATGPMASENVYAFSTKRYDSATDWVHYEYRIYRPREGGWPNRDPIGEKGGLNPYGFVDNDPINAFDPYGLDIAAPYRQMQACKNLQKVLDTSANSQVKDALAEYIKGGAKKISYGPNDAWTQALQKHSHLDGVRERIREHYRKRCAGSYGATSGQDDFNLNSLSTAENAKLFLRDLAAPFLGINMANTTGSIRFRWQQKGANDCCCRQVTIAFIASDTLRLGSNTRIPTTTIEIVPDNAFGPNGPLHNVDLEWNWTEIISY